MFRPRFVSTAPRLVRILPHPFTSVHSLRKYANRAAHQRKLDKTVSKESRASPQSHLYPWISSGYRKISNPRDAHEFLSATLSEKDDPIGVVERILVSPHGLTYLHDAFNIEDAPEYFDMVLQPVLSWLQHPALQAGSNGLYLRRTLQALVNPSGSKFWNAYHSHVKYELVSQQSMQCFAWLLLQLLTHTRNVRPIDFMIARDPLLRSVLADSTYGDTKHLGKRIQRIYELHEAARSRRGRSAFQPQHDNDFQNFKDISVFPTAQEVAHDEMPRTLRATEVFNEPDPNRRLYMYLANLFRLYRQDWLEEVKDQVKVALGKEADNPRAITTLAVKMTGISCRDTVRKHGQHQWSLKLECQDDLSELRGLNTEQRKAFVKDDTDFIPDGSLGIVVADEKPVAIVKVLRDEALLTKSILCVQIPNHELVQQAMLSMMDATNLKLILLNAAGYAYEPVLSRLQNTTEIPFEQEILSWDAKQTVNDSEALNNDGIKEIVRQLEEKPELNLQNVMRLKGSVILDSSQAGSLIASLKQRLSLVQGPPGTGKSFIGALAAKALHDHTSEKILVVCHTNQALDQFIQDIRKVGVSDSQIVRLGGQERTDPANHPLLLSALQVDGTRRHDRGTRTFVKDIERQVLDEALRLEDLYHDLFSLDSLRDHLDSLAMRGDGKYSQAFEISLEVNGTKRMTESGSVADRHYLLRRWIDGKGAGAIFPEKKKYTDVWDLSLEDRKQLCSGWWSFIRPKSLAAFLEKAKHHDDLLSQAKSANGRTNEQIIRSKRIVACTTSGAAKYPQIQTEAPGIIIVEEAGQVLESHIITALNPTAKQLILIGDHKQLRPFINYKLSVEKGDGYDLNRSMFERLVLKGYPHQVLAQQHRMRPEISNLVRQLTYPDLIDAPKTQGRPDLRGFSDNVIFVNHDHPEDQAKDDPETVNVRTSKRNSFEAEMTFKTVKYLLQQNYAAGSIVVLTPYLGQLKKLQEVFGKDFETVLSEFDIKNMEKNGLIEDSSKVKGSSRDDMSTDTASVPTTNIDRKDSAVVPTTHSTESGGSAVGGAIEIDGLPVTETEVIKRGTSNASPKPAARPKIQISTIDNYQGQESDIVVASLTRSNPEGDIGFLSSPERLNVLLSRARNALILIGNSTTFKNANQGKHFWTHLFQLLEHGKHIYQGLAVKCENHPHNTAVLQTPRDFEENCPEGGCTEPCGVVLRCGVHECTSKCHHLGDHSKVLCHAVIDEVCNRGRHVQRFECHERLNVISKPCELCQLEDEAERKSREEADQDGGERA